MDCLVASLLNCAAPTRARVSDTPTGLGQGGGRGFTPAIRRHRTQPLRGRVEWRCSTRGSAALQPRALIRNPVGIQADLGSTPFFPITGALAEGWKSVSLVLRHFHVHEELLRNRVGDGRHDGGGVEFQVTGTCHLDRAWQCGQFTATPPVLPLRRGRVGWCRR